MANEFICSDCKGDGTRCDCHKKRNYSNYTPWKSDDEKRQERLRELELEQKENFRKLRELNLYRE